MKTKERAKKLSTETVYDDYQYHTNSVTGEKRPGTNLSKGTVESDKEYSVPTYKMGADTNSPEFRKDMKRVDDNMRRYGTLDRFRWPVGPIRRHQMELKKDEVYEKYKKKRNEKQN